MKATRMKTSAKVWSALITVELITKRAQSKDPTNGLFINATPTLWTFMNSLCLSSRLKVSK